MWVARNSALLFEPGRGNTGYYAKMQLVPFSEFVPFKKSLPGVHNFLRGFVPPVMTQLDSGREPYRFVFTRSAQANVEGAEQVRFGAPICYEGTFARVCRDLVYSPEGDKRADLLVNISNDGWFVWPDSREGTTEQAQHLTHYVFRAVENRVPVVRVVNTGISGVIDSNGRIQDIAGGSPENLNASVVTEATLIAGITLDRRSSLYSLVGDVFAQGVSLIAVALLIWWTAPVIRRKAKGSSDESVS
jgi:apolipoprotein N-acyltransferase